MALRCCLALWIFQAKGTPITTTSSINIRRLRESRRPRLGFASVGAAIVNLLPSSPLDTVRLTLSDLCKAVHTTREIGMQLVARVSLLTSSVLLAPTGVYLYRS